MSISKALFLDASNPSMLWWHIPCQDSGLYIISVPQCCNVHTKSAACLIVSLSNNSMGFCFSTFVQNLTKWFWFGALIFITIERYRCHTSPSIPLVVPSFSSKQTPYLENKNLNEGNGEVSACHICSQLSQPKIYTAHLLLFSLSLSLSLSPLSCQIVLTLSSSMILPLMHQANTSQIHNSLLLVLI